MRKVSRQREEVREEVRKVSRQREEVKEEVRGEGMEGGEVSLTSKSAPKFIRW